MEDFQELKKIILEGVVIQGTPAQLDTQLAFIREKIANVEKLLENGK